MGTSLPLPYQNVPYNFPRRQKNISVQEHRLPVPNRENLTRRLKTSRRLWHLIGKYAKYVANFYANRKFEGADQVDQAYAVSHKIGTLG
jgi:hypothetical protein